MSTGVTRPPSDIWTVVTAASDQQDKDDTTRQSNPETMRRMNPDRTRRRQRASSA